MPFFWTHVKNSRSVKISRMTGLILDSSTDTLILAIDQPQCWQTHKEAARIGSNLFPLIDAFVSEELSYIAVGRGPGSYTGTRAAVAAATGFSQGAGIPLILFPSPLAFLPVGDRVAAILEIKGAKMNYILFYEEGALREMRAPLAEILPELADLDAVASEQPLPELPHSPLHFHAEAAISRIGAWAKGRVASTASENQLTYLHQI